MHVEFEELYVCYDTITKKCVCISRQEFLIRRYITNNKINNVVMGCYGIGPGRILASVVEQNNDEKGMIFPLSIAPFKVAIAALNTKDEKCMEIANKLYEELNNNGIDTVLDDRDERPGVKFNDLDLIGIPIRVTVGKKISDDLVEFKLRTESASKDINIENVVSIVKEYINENIWWY